MKRVVAIDGHNLALQRGTGVATYAKNLADNIVELGWDAWTLYGAPISPKYNDLVREISFFDYLGGTAKKRGAFADAYDFTKEFFRAPFGYEALKIPLSGMVEGRRFASRLPQATTIYNVQNLFNIARRYFTRHKKFLPIRFENPPDVMHWTYPLPVRVVGVPNIYTIHDLVPLRLPYTTLDNKRFYYRLIKGCIQSGERICTVSERSKDDIRLMFDVPESRIVNTYQSVETNLSASQKTQEEAEQEVEGVYGLKPKSYFLFFGAIEPKKNISRLIEAFLAARLNTKLVIVGVRAWKSDDEMRLYDSIEKRNSGEKSKIHIFDYAPRPFLISLIRAAKAVVFPSLYEGFGLPVLEAMQLGTPTLCSNGGSLPEIAGSASICVDPYDTSDIRRGLEMLDADESLRSRFSVEGIERAKIFGAESYRKKLQSLYDEVLTGK